ncbi:hypothetical protein MTR67_027871 [Solanum verrucosum]|uniref:Uncharacterized protein n=1 Tax=Solanum verrucosum TaxID=315347 RepID=A0AAF0R316_SOLVR|nr:hypothetical protein MTR67_027871 [Solanum verrucosum]
MPRAKVWKCLAPTKESHGPCLNIHQTYSAVGSEEKEEAEQEKKEATGKQRRKQKEEENRRKEKQVSQQLNPSSQVPENEMMLPENRGRSCALSQIVSRRKAKRRQQVALPQRLKREASALHNTASTHTIVSS